MKKILLLLICVVLITIGLSNCVKKSYDMKIIYCPLKSDGGHSKDIYVAILNLGTGAVSTYNYSDCYAASISVDSQGNAWLAGNPGAKIHPSGNVLATTSGDLKILQMRIANDDTVWALGRDVMWNHYLVHFDSDGSVLFQSEALGPGVLDGGNLSVGLAMAIDLDGNIWLHGSIAEGNEELSKRSPTGELLALCAPAPSLEQVQDIKADKLGNIWIIDHYDTWAFLRKIDTDGNVLATYNAPSGQHYMGLAIDPNNKIWVSCTNNKIYRISQDGVVEETYEDTEHTVTMFIQIGSDDVHYGHSATGASGLVKLNNDAEYQDGWDLTGDLGDHKARGDAIYDEEEIVQPLISLIG